MQAKTKVALIQIIAETERSEFFPSKCLRAKISVINGPKSLKASHFMARFARHIFI